MALTARHGALAILFAKLLFLASGYVLYGALGRLLTTEEFGIYGVVFGWVSLINMVLINGTMQTVSRFVATQPDAASSVRARSFVYQAGFVTLFLGSFVLGAPLLGDFLNDASIVPLLRLASLITLAYAFYAINIGYFNGRQLFVKQAFFDVTFSVLKVSLIIAFVSKFGGVRSVVIGFASAAFIVMVLSFLLGRFQKSEKKAEITPVEFGRFALSAMAVALLMNLMLTADLFFLKRMSALNDADQLAGYYTAAQSIARIPYFLMATASLILFPMMAKLSAKDVRPEERAEASSRGLSAVLGVLAGMPALTIPLADRVMTVLYPAPYAAAAPAFSWLVLACCVLSLVSVATTLISGAGRPALAAGILIIGLVVQATGAYFLIDGTSLAGAGVATTIAATVAFGLGAIVLYRQFKTRITLRVFGVVAIASSTAFGLSTAFAHFVPESGLILTVAFLGLGYFLYLAVLALGGVLLGDGGDRSRVLFVTKPLDPPFNDASKVFPYALAHAFDPRAIAVCTTKKGSKAEGLPEGIERIPVYSSADGFVGRNTQNLRMFGYLLLHRYRFRAIHFFFSPNPATSGAIRLLRMITPGVPFFQTVMSRPNEYEARLFFGDAVLCGSEETRKRVAALEMGRDVHLVRPGIAPVEALPAKERAPGDEFHVLFAGDIDHGGALEHLEQAVPILFGASDVPVQLHFSIRTKTAETNARAQAFVDRVLKPFGDRVTTYVNHAQFAELLALQDAMIFPAVDLLKKLDAPLVILETMALGKPVFTLDHAPINEIAPPELRGQLIAADARGLAENILAYARAPQTISAHALRQRIETAFHIQETARAYQTIHEQHCKNRQPDVLQLVQHQLREGPRPGLPPAGR